MIKQDILDLKLNRVVVASCSPHLHEQTFRNALASGDLNSFFLQMVNIREQDSWVTTDKQAGHPEGAGPGAGCRQKGSL